MGRRQVHRREGEKKEVDQGLWGDGKYIGEKERRRKWTKACGEMASAWARKYMGEKERRRK